MSDRAEITPGAAPIEFYEEPNWWLNLERAYNVLCVDRLVKPLDTLYFFGRSYFDAPKRSFYGRAVNLYQQGMVKKIIIPGTEGERYGDRMPRLAHPGKTLMRNRLVGMGVADADIVFSKPAYQTKQEGDVFLDYSMENSLSGAVALTNPHQIVRAMLGLVRTINKNNFPLEVYAAMSDPNNFDWGRMVRGSQGKELKPVFKHLYEEFYRISQYQRKGDLASFDELFQYLKTRSKLP